MSTAQRQSQSGQHSIETCAIFHDARAFESAVFELQRVGVDRQRLSVLATDTAIDEKLSHYFVHADTLEEGADVARTAHVDQTTKTETKAMALGALGYAGAVTAAGSVVVSGGGTLAAAFAALGAGGGSAVLGEILGRMLGVDGNGLEKQVEAGGVALWVAVADEDEANTVSERLLDAGASSTKTHRVTLQGPAEDNPVAGKAVDPFLKHARV